MTLTARQLSVERVRPPREQVADQIRRLIIDGNLAPGQRLPREVELAERLGVGRATLRAAIRMLAEEGLVTTSRGANGGTTVSIPEHIRIARFLNGSISLLTGTAGLSVAELLEAREVLEVPASAFAAERRDDELLEALKASIDGTSATEPAKGYVQNRDFHYHLVVASGNRFLQLMAEPVFQTLQNRIVLDDPGSDMWSVVHQDHLEIYEAIQRGDSEAAGAAMAKHLRNLRPYYEDAIARATTEPRKGSRKVSRSR